MTTADAHAADLGAILARTRYLLIDFDGPICSIYAGLPAPQVAAQLRKLFTGHQLPNDIQQTGDPIEVFAYAGTVSPDLAARVEAEMTDLEVEATASAKPTPYIHEVLAASRGSGRTVGVVSNNGARAVNTYLERNGLSDSIRLVVARTSHDPALLKPSPYLIEKALRGLDDADPAATTLVGDSITDIEGAHRAGIGSIGYVNKPGKYERMTQAGAGAVITSMADLALWLRARPLSD
jgi:phosphoglycolate phosphatase